LIILLNKIKCFPKPNKRHRYCGVCKTNYEEYLEHINAPDHRRKFAQNEYISKIELIVREINVNFEDPKY